MEIGRLRGCLCRRWEQQDGPEFPFTRGCLQGRRWASQEGAALLGLALVPWDMGWGWAWGSRVLAKPRQFVYPMPLVSVGPHTQPTPPKAPSGSFGAEVLIPEPFLRRAGLAAGRLPSSQTTVPSVDALQCSRPAPSPHPVQIAGERPPAWEVAPWFLLSPPSPSRLGRRPACIARSDE